MNARPKPLYYPGPCVTCGTGFYLPSGRCDHCNSLQPDKIKPSEPKPPFALDNIEPLVDNALRAAFKAGYRCGLLDGKWRGLWVGIGLLFGAGITIWVLL